MTGMQIKKNACKNAYLGSIFIPEKYVMRVLFVSPWTSLIPPLAIRVAPGKNETIDIEYNKMKHAVFVFEYQIIILNFCLSC